MRRRADERRRLALRSLLVARVSGRAAIVARPAPAGGGVVFRDVLGISRYGEVDQVVDGLGLHLRKNEGRPTVRAPRQVAAAARIAPGLREAAVVGGVVAWHEALVRVNVEVRRKSQLLEVVGALHAAGRLAGGLHGRQQQGDTRMPMMAMTTSNSTSVKPVRRRGAMCDLPIGEPGSAAPAAKHRIEIRDAFSVATRAPNQTRRRPSLARSVIIAAADPPLQTWP